MSWPIWAGLLLDQRSGLHGSGLKPKHCDQVFFNMTSITCGGDTPHLYVYFFTFVVYWRLLGTWYCSILQHFVCACVGFSQIVVWYTGRALYKNVGCRWLGSLNFVTERAHVFQYVCVFNLISRRSLNFLAMQEVVCLFFQSANCFSEPPPALVPINFFANIQILGLKSPGSSIS